VRSSSDELDEVPEDRPVVFFQRTRAKAVRREAARPKPSLCRTHLPLVSKVHRERPSVISLRGPHRSLIDRPHAGHPEVIGTIGPSCPGRHGCCCPRGRGAGPRRPAVARPVQPRAYATQGTPCRSMTRSRFVTALAAAAPGAIPGDEGWRTSAMPRPNVGRR